MTYIAADQTSPRDQYRQAAADAHRDWRLYCISVKRDWFPEQKIIKLGVGEIAALRLQRAYLPLLGTLSKIEEKIFRLMKACSYEREDKWHSVRPARIVADDLPPLFIGAPSSDFIGACHRDLATTVEMRARAA